MKTPRETSRFEKDFCNNEKHAQWEMSANIKGVKLYAVSVTEEHREKVLRHWRKMKATNIQINERENAPAMLEWSVVVPTNKKGDIHLTLTASTEESARNQLTAMKYAKWQMWQAKIEQVQPVAVSLFPTEDPAKQEVAPVATQTPTEEIAPITVEQATIEQEEVKPVVESEVQKEETPASHYKTAKQFVSRMRKIFNNRSTIKELDALPLEARLRNIQSRVEFNCRLSGDNALPRAYDPAAYGLVWTVRRGVEPEVYLALKALSTMELCQLIHTMLVESGENAGDYAQWLMNRFSSKQDQPIEAIDQPTIDMSPISETQQPSCPDQQIERENCMHSIDIKVNSDYNIDTETNQTTTGGDQTMTTTITPSKYQQNIYNFVQESLSTPEKRQNLIISAVAGSGKSTTIKELLRYIPAHMSVLYLTFMREVNLDLGGKVEDMKATLNGHCPKAVVRTCHSIGNGCVKDFGIKGDPSKNGRKYARLCQNWLRAHMSSYSYKVAEQMAKLVDKVRVTLSDTDEKSLLKLLDRFDIALDPSDDEVWPLVLKAVPEILAAGIKAARLENSIDFTDQIWLPSSKALNLEPEKYDVVMIDEAQDLSPCIRELALKAAKKDGMVISVGDRRQAIMGFAGASMYSLDELKQATHAAELPLNENYRCPRSVIQMAQKFVPEIEAWEGATEGEVSHIYNDSIADMAQTGDMILCRWNAPLISLAIELIRMRKRCIVKGKDLGGDVTAFLDRIVKFYTELDRFFYGDLMFTDLYKYVNEYQSRMLAILKQDEEQNESKISKLEDSVNTLLALYEGHQEELANGAKPDYDGFKNFITDFFAEHGESKGEMKADARRYTITLSTGHKAKGLENPNVFVVSYDELPSNKAKTPEAIEQEENLLYVMLTRPQCKLFLGVKDVHSYEEQPAIEVAEIVATAEEIISAQNSPLEAPETAVIESEVPSPVQTTKKGRKAKDDSEKVVKLDTRLDPMIREGLARLMAKLEAEETTDEERARLVSHSTHKVPTISDVVMEALLNLPAFREVNPDLEAAYEEKRGKK